MGSRSSSVDSSASSMDEWFIAPDDQGQEVERARSVGGLIREGVVKEGVVDGEEGNEEGPGEDGEMVAVDDEGGST